MIEEKHKTEEYDLLGMTCLSCADSAQRALARVPGVHQAEVNFVGRSARVDYDPQQAQFEQLAAAVRTAGYTLVADKRDLQQASKTYFSDLRLRVWVAFGFAVPIFVLSLFFPHSFAGQAWVELALSLPVVFYAGRGFYLNAYRQARHGQISMDTLVALGTGSAFVVALLGVLFPGSALHRMPVHFESAAVVIAFILVGNWIEESAKNRTDDALDSLGSLLPRTATRLGPQGAEQIAVSDIRVGDRLEVAPGMAIPVDGSVWQGETYVDESMLSGESVPVHKQKPDTLMAGTQNQDGTIQMIARQVGQGTVLQQIIEQVKRAQGTRPPAQRLADRIAGIFVPLVLAIAVLAALAWALWVPGGDWTIGLYTALAILVVSCPCALGLATPVAIKVGMGTATRAGILLRHATALEVAARMDTLVFDKTGTLTRGTPRVYEAEYEPALAGAAGQYMALVASTVAESAHPLSKAVGGYLRSLTHTSRLPDLVHQYGGKGVEAHFGSYIVRVGRGQWLLDSGCQLGPQLQQAAARMEEGYSLVYAAVDRQVFGLFGLADQVKPESAEVLGRLKQEGVQVVMLTGDHQAAAAAVAAELDIQHWQAGMMPDQKAAYIHELKAKGRKVAMLGDGINDAVAFAAADLPIAMSTGADIAIDSADVVLLHGNLALLLRLRSLSRSTRRIIRQNLAWAFAYNLLAIPLAAGVLYPLLLSPMVAGGLMAVSSLTVVLNSLRLRKKL